MDRWQATSLVGVAIAGQAVAYVLSVLVARRLGVDGFEAYVVASAVFILLATFAPRGAEKYALRRLTKKYGAGEDYQFVNGLLGAVARDHGLSDEAVAESAEQ